MLLIAKCGVLNTPRMMLELVVFLVIFDTMFYYSHRLLHTGRFYKYHKVKQQVARQRLISPTQSHHSWRAPIAAATAYGHPVDFLLHCVLPVAMGPVMVLIIFIHLWEGLLNAPKPK